MSDAKTLAVWLEEHKNSGRVSFMTASENLKAALVELRKYQDEKELNVKLGGNYPRTGRTTAMLNACIDAVLEGQPKSVVIGHSQWYARQLQIQMRDLMEKRGLNEIDSRYKTLTIFYQGSEIRFMSKEKFSEFIRGHRGWGEFWDHWAEGEN